MSQRNPMNERYTLDKHTGNTRKSAASAKPKTKAAASVTTSSPKKSTKEKKAEQKAARKAEQERQREIDRKYYKPDTENYKKLRRIWWIALVGAVLCVIASWMLRGVQPEWLAMAALFAAYGLIIFAFYIDFSKIRKERKAYQERMIALELEEAKKNKSLENKKKKVSAGTTPSKMAKKAKAEKGSSKADGTGKDEGKGSENENNGADTADVKSNAASKPKKKLFGRAKKAEPKSDDDAEETQK